MSGVDTKKKRELVDGYYERLKERPEEWHTTADNLKAGAQVLFEAWRQSTDENGEPLHLDHLHLVVPACLLYSYYGLKGGSGNEAPELVVKGYRYGELAAIQGKGSQSAFQPLIHAADGYVLQVHSLERPKSFDTAFTLCDPGVARGAVAKATQIGMPDAG